MWAWLMIVVSLAVALLAAMPARMFLAHLESREWGYASLAAFQAIVLAVAAVSAFIKSGAL